MTQGRKIAIAYVFAVPAVLAVVLFQRVTLVRIEGVEGNMLRAADVLRNCDRAIALLKESELRPGTRVGKAAGESNQAVDSELASVIQRIRQLTRGDAAAQARFQALDRLTAERTALRQSLRTLAGTRAPAAKLAAAEARDTELRNGIAEIIGQLRTARQDQYQQQAGGASQSVRWANAAVLYGGFLTVWLVAVAAVLLFHDERTRVWKGIERRVHTKVLQELPIGVCLTTGGGTVLYSNSAQDATLGYEPGELYGKDVSALVSASPAEPAFDDLVDRLLPNQTWYGELELTRKDMTSLRVASWVTNLEVAGKFFRVYLHDSFSRQVHPEVLEIAGRVNGN
ncbi:MAG TPA: PAS domain-containing protein [Terriglobia bacterium]|nr:PAS domain-containing protein [Terriglobia bacterium]